MQIKLSDGGRADFYGNAVEGVYLELVNPMGLTYLSHLLSEGERKLLIHQLTKTDNGRSV